MYKWKQISCEICNHPYDSASLFKHKILDYVVPDENYMILESVSKSCENKTIYVVLLNNQEFKIGRGKDLDI